MIRPRNEAAGLLLSKTKNCEKLIKQTHTKLQETLDFGPTQPGKIFSFKRSNNLGLESKTMIGLTSLELNNFFKILKKTSSKVIQVFLMISFTELKDELDDILGLSDISHEHLQDNKKRKHNIKVYQNLSSEKGQTDGYYMLLSDYARTPFQNFETFLRNVVSSDENGIQLFSHMEYPQH